MPKGVYPRVGNSKRKPEPIEGRFWSKVKKNEETGCWEWTATKNKTGYGSVAYVDDNGKTKMQRSHRVSWIMKNGKIPDGMNVLHKCDNPSCVNPDHLFLGTHKDNMEDMCLKGRSYLKNGGIIAAKLNPDQVIEILKSNDKVKDIAKRYSITRGSVRNIKRRITWRSLNVPV